MPSILETGEKVTIDAVKTSVPSKFTVGGYIKDGKIVGGVTYDRKLSNGWGLTAFARAWWDDLPVTAHDGTFTVHAGHVEAGIEASKTFGA